ncbi:NUDIX hydrolase [Brachybacterium saurashtrense]|uniref:NUDIX domain-containing protein n=1 Tax=Brachybacterium saurashtrense TaxID=556288 RepID=A0A345YSA1_9MICO|nr:NUDIX domain-containing protein [Brachybacterium saurashtrense]AXK46803.1 NUDIX domain-containing protein [Brachybacterium saurashtrense]RRR22518.1 NUDIX domain-containing protein [Brachybacterium saurashtrense]
MAASPSETTSPEIRVAVDLIVLTLREGALSVLLIQRDDEPHRGAWALPGGFIAHGEDLEDAAYRVLSDEASLGSGAVHLEQVRTFGTPGRDPRGHVVSVAFMALGADLPDPRRGEDVADARWWPLSDLCAVTLAFDHATVLDSAVERARSKLEYTTLAVTFLPEEFTVSQLRGVYESVWGTTLDAGNFHRKATRTEGFLEELDRYAAPTGGRPARLYRAGAGTSLVPPLLRSGD